MSAWCSLILYAIVLSVSPKYFLQQQQVTLYTPPHALPLLKGFVSSFDYIDKDLVNITSKPYLLLTRLSCSDIPFSYGIKKFDVSKIWLFFDLLLDDNVWLLLLLIFQGNHLTIFNYVTIYP